MSNSLRTVILFTAVAGLFTAPTACGDSAVPDFSDDPVFTSFDSAGVEMLVTTFSEPVPSSGWTISAEPTVVFGREGPDPVEWFDIDDAARLSDGRVVALDAGLRTLFYFSPTGELLASAGREGEGPGEFTDPAGLALLEGDTILVYAQGIRRFSVFDDEGTWLEDRSLEEAELLGRLSNYRLADAANGSTTLTGVGWLVPRDTGNEDQTLDNPVLRYGVDGSYEGEIAEPNTMWIFRSGGGVQPRVFGAPRISRVHDGYVFVRDGGGYEIRVYGPSGSLERIHRLIRPRRPVEDGDVERYGESLKTEIENPRILTRVLDRLDDRPVADSFPSLEDHYVDELGDIWVTQYGPPWQEGRMHAVFAADGPWIGTVDLPDDFVPLDIGEDYLLGSLTDELDVQHLVLFELEREEP